MEADAIQTAVYNVILAFQDFHAIENLFIEMEFIGDFLPEEQQHLEIAQSCTYMLSAIKLIMQSDLQAEQPEDLANVEQMRQSHEQKEQHSNSSASNSSDNNDPKGYVMVQTERYASDEDMDEDSSDQESEEPETFQQME